MFAQKEIIRIARAVKCMTFNYAVRRLMADICHGKNMLSETIHEVSSLKRRLLTPERFVERYVNRYKMDKGRECVSIVQMTDKKHW